MRERERENGKKGREINQLCVYMHSSFASDSSTLRLS